mmetsp:Transcript_17808/g.26133  ORF Transcript_17808/g.26133 Transcript_17808/m.26133 type:complete len:93 (-) Transcript_17808:165-443(-)
MHYLLVCFFYRRPTQQRQETSRIFSAHTPDSLYIAATAHQRTNTIAMRKKRQRILHNVDGYKRNPVTSLNCNTGHFQCAASDIHQQQQVTKT